MLRFFRITKSCQRRNGKIVGQKGVEYPRLNLGGGGRRERKKMADILQIIKNITKGKTVVFLFRYHQNRHFNLTKNRPISVSRLALDF